MTAACVNQAIASLVLRAQHHIPCIDHLSARKFNPHTKTKKSPIVGATIRTMYLSPWGRTGAKLSSSLPAAPPAPPRVVSDDMLYGPNNTHFFPSIVIAMYDGLQISLHWIEKVHKCQKQRDRSPVGVFFRLFFFSFSFIISLRWVSSANTRASKEWQLNQDGRREKGPGQWAN